MTRCKKHSYDYLVYCWFCFCEYAEIPDTTNYWSEELKEKHRDFLKKFPNGNMSIIKQIVEETID